MRPWKYYGNVFIVSWIRKELVCSAGDKIAGRSLKFVYRHDHFTSINTIYRWWEQSIQWTEMIHLLSATNNTKTHKTIKFSRSSCENTRGVFHHFTPFPTHNSSDLVSWRHQGERFVIFHCEVSRRKLIALAWLSRLFSCFVDRFLKK